MIVPPIGRGLVAEKPNVIETEAFPAMRSLEAIANEKKVTCVGVNIPPDDTEVEATVSADVCTLTATDPAVAAPMVKPLIVTVNAAVVKAAPDVVMISAVAAGALHVPAIVKTLALPATIVGVAEDAKKAEGYVIVIVPPGGRGETGVKLKVTGTDVLAANLSDAAMTKVTEDT